MSGTSQWFLEKMQWRGVKFEKRFSNGSSTTKAKLHQSKTETEAYFVASYYITWIQIRKPHTAIA